LPESHFNHIYRNGNHGRLGVEEPPAYTNAMHLTFSKNASCLLNAYILFLGRVK
jgi:hypothetical protein